MLKFIRSFFRPKKAVWMVWVKEWNGWAIVSAEEAAHLFHDGYKIKLEKSKYYKDE